MIIERHMRFGLHEEEYYLYCHLINMMTGQNGKVVISYTY